MLYTGRDYDRPVIFDLVLFTIQDYSAPARLKANESIEIVNFDTNLFTG